MSKALGNIRSVTTTEIKMTVKHIAAIPVKLRIKETSSNKHVLSNSMAILKINDEIVLKLKLCWKQVERLAALQVETETKEIMRTSCW